MRGTKFQAGAEAVAVTIDRPLGIVFEEKSDGSAKIVVDEIVPGSNAEKADVKVGDVLRITTAVFNVPGVVDVRARGSTRRRRATVRRSRACDGEPAEKCMNAITSHAVPVDTPSGEVEIDEAGSCWSGPGRRGERREGGARRAV